MSDAQPTATALVDADSSVYDASLDCLVGLGVLSFVLGLLSLVGLLPLGASGADLTTPLLALLAVIVGGMGAVALAVKANVVAPFPNRVRGIAGGVIVAALGFATVAALGTVPLATLFGVVLLVEAGGVAVAGLVSFLGSVGSSPDETAGLLAGLSFGTIGLLVGSAVAGSILGFGSPRWIVGGLLAGFALVALTVLPREDLGTTLPAALVVGTLGVTLATAAIGVGWEWEPAAISGGFTGGAVVPLFVLVGGLLSAWAASKSRAGFGAQGRQDGAFLVINLNAFLMLAAMLAIVAFVTVKGVGYAFHGLQVGALSLLVALAPLLGAALQFARTPGRPGEWHPGARRLLQLTPLTVVGALIALSTTVLVTGEALTYPFTYTVQVDREPQTLDTAISLTSTPQVGALLLTLAGGLSVAALLRRYGSLRGVGTEPARLASLRHGVSAAVVCLLLVAVLLGLAGSNPIGIPFGRLLGSALVALAAAGTLLLTAAPLGATVAGDGNLSSRLRDAAPTLTVGMFGGLSLLTAAVLLQPAAGIAPTVFSIPLVPAAALVAATLSAVFVLSALRARSDVDSSLERRVLDDEVTLGLVGVAGYLALVGLHVQVTTRPFTVGGVTIAQAGTVSWPMAMQAYIPLGAEPGGIMPAVVGTVWLVIGATLFAVPLGVGAAVFLTEYAEQGRFTALVEIATNALWSTPSVVFGLFGAAFLIPRLGGDTSLLAGMLVLGFMLLPLVLITSREAVKAVPDEYRDASAALGATRWQTIRSVVLPAAMPGVITGGILGVGRIAGETAPLILVLGSTLNATESVHVLRGFRFVSHPPFVTNDQLLSASASLPTQVWAVIAAGVSGSPSMGWATAFLLLAVVLTFYTVGIATRSYFRRKITHD